MAVKRTYWQADNGLNYDTQEEAEKADAEWHKLSAIASVIRGPGITDSAAVRAAQKLLQTYNLILKGNEDGRV